MRIPPTAISDRASMTSVGNAPKDLIAEGAVAQQVMAAQKSNRAVVRIPSRERLPTRCIKRVRPIARANPTAPKADMDAIMERIDEPGDSRAVAVAATVTPAAAHASP